jgi:hypothetical protein
MKYDEGEIKKLYQDNLSKGMDALVLLPVAERKPPPEKLLSGWIFEKTIRCCLCKELELLSIIPTVEEQVQLKGRAKVDLLVGKAAIEIKSSGIFSSKDEQKYRKYREIAEGKGWSYFYLTLGESYPRYRDLMRSAFGVKRAFFLNPDGDWDRFVNEVRRNLN